METYLKTIEGKIKEHLSIVKELQYEADQYKEFLEYKKSKGSTTDKTPVFETHNNDDITLKTWIEQIKHVLSTRNTEMFSDDITAELQRYHKDKSPKWLSTRVSAEISEKADENGIYKTKNSYKNTGKHHKALVYGLIKFRDENGTVKAEHRYK